MGADCVGQVHDSGNEVGHGEVGGHLVLDASQHAGRGHRAGQADGQPRHPMPQASAHCFLAGGSGVSSGGQEAAEPVEILVVLGEQDAGQPVGRDEPLKVAVFVDHCQSGFRPLRRQPCGPLLMRARGHRRRVVVHHVSQHGVRRRRQQSFDGGKAHQTPVGAHGHHDGAVEGGPAHPVQHCPDTLLRLGHRNVANRVSGGGADPLVQLLCQIRVRCRVWRYLMSAHSVIPSHGRHCRTSLWTLSASLATRVRRQRTL